MTHTGIWGEELLPYEAARFYAMFLCLSKGGAVIKPDGLTGGKGVVVCSSIQEAWDAVKAHWPYYAD